MESTQLWKNGKTLSVREFIVVQIEREKQKRGIVCKIFTETENKNACKGRKEMLKSEGYRTDEFELT